MGILGEPYPTVVHPAGTSGRIMRGACISGDDLRKAKVHWNQEQRWLHSTLDDFANMHAGPAFGDRANHLNHGPTQPNTSLWQLSTPRCTPKEVERAKWRS